MERALVKGSTVKVPPGLAFLFSDPPLVGDEKGKDYENLFSAIVDVMKPRGAVVWLLARDFTDLSWEIRRERNLKLELIRLTDIEVVSKLLSPITPALLPSNMSVVAGKTDKLAKQWAGDAEARQRVISKLAEKGYDASDILTLALNRAAPQVETIDRRIGNYELRRWAVMKAIEQYSEASARRLAASTDVTEGEFTVAEE
jgi:hypothetical protein